jgi:hypothetical protein
LECGGKQFVQVSAAFRPLLFPSFVFLDQDLPNHLFGPEPGCDRVLRCSDDLLFPLLKASQDLLEMPGDDTKVFQKRADDALLPVILTKVLE